MDATDIATFDPATIYAELIEAGTTWAEANAAADLLEQTKKTLLSKLKLQSSEKSDAARETEALGSRDYDEHIRLMVAARERADVAKVQYDSLCTLAELRRSQYSTRRAEMVLAQTGALG